jgi:ribonuclease BN (tRNA processing enzyme)
MQVALLRAQRHGPLRHLGHIFVSHLHGDHVAGLLSVVMGVDGAWESSESSVSS